MTDSRRLTVAQRKLYTGKDMPPPAQRLKARAMLGHLELGHYPTIAARRAKLPWYTVETWLRLGSSSTNRWYFAFKAMYRLARTTCEWSAVDVVRTRIQEGDLKAATWYLEHAKPERWSAGRMRKEVQVTVDASRQTINLPVQEATRMLREWPSKALEGDNEKIKEYRETTGSDGIDG